MAFNPGIVKKILDGLGTQPISGIESKIRVVYLCNDDKALVGTHNHEFMGRLTVSAVSSANGSTTITHTVPDGEIWLCVGMVVNNSDGVNSFGVNRYTVDGNELYPTFASAGDYGVGANVRQVWGGTKGFFLGTAMVTEANKALFVAHPYPARRSVVLGAGAWAGTTGVTTNLYYYTRNITPQER